MTEVKKYKKVEVWEAMKVTEAMLQRPGLNTIRDFMRNVTSIEIEPNRIIVYTEKYRFYISSGDWILRDDFMHTRVCTEKVFLRDYSPLN
ncbi:MAG: hypothetical protein A2Y71_03120 [Bacteroidetes bacterium RBG_13_42_15]|nr:MAG: hypothetical protein A2Y71_03120 [Bacteroidetes bacterium RBG_13_42_15]